MAIPLQTCPSLPPPRFSSMKSFKSSNISSFLFIELGCPVKHSFMNNLLSLSLSLSLPLPLPPTHPYLSCQDKVSKHGHGGDISRKVSDRFHDIPGVLPPGQASKEPKLQRHEGHPSPHPDIGVGEGAGLQLLLLLLQRS